MVRRRADRQIREMMNADRVAVAFVALDDAGAAVGASFLHIFFAGSVPLRAE
jgi:hypothetical protein